MVTPAGNNIDPMVPVLVTPNSVSVANTVPDIHVMANHVPVTAPVVVMMSPPYSPGMPILCMTYLQRTGGPKPPKSLVLRRIQRQERVDGPRREARPGSVVVVHPQVPQVVHR